MAVRATWLAILVGGAFGSFTALVGRSSAPPPVALAPPIASPPRPIDNPPDREPDTASSTAGSSVTSAPVAPPENPNANASADDSASADRSTSADGSANRESNVIATRSSSSAPSAPAPAQPSATTSLDNPPAPETKEALLHAEMHCDRKEAAACALAARGYETGSAGPSDPEKAAKYRRIALTLWISQCDHSSTAACAVLTDMYRTGRGVPQNAKTADALLLRTRELCHYNDAPVCHSLPNP